MDTLQSAAVGEEPRDLKQWNMGPPGGQPGPQPLHSCGDMQARPGISPVPPGNMGSTGHTEGLRGEAGP